MSATTVLAAEPAGDMPSSPPPSTGAVSDDGDQPFSEVLSRSAPDFPGPPTSAPGQRGAPVADEPAPDEPAAEPAPDEPATGAGTDPGAATTPATQPPVPDPSSPAYRLHQAGPAGPAHGDAPGTAGSPPDPSSAATTAGSPPAGTGPAPATGQGGVDAGRGHIDQFLPTPTGPAVTVAPSAPTVAPPDPPPVSPTSDASGGGAPEAGLRVVRAGADPHGGFAAGPTVVPDPSVPPPDPVGADGSVPTEPGADGRFDHAPPDPAGPGTSGGPVSSATLHRPIGERGALPGPTAADAGPVRIQVGGSTPEAAGSAWATWATGGTAAAPVTTAGELPEFPDLTDGSVGTVGTVGQGIDIGGLAASISRPLAAGNGDYSVQVSLHPPEFGEVRALLSLQGDVLHVTLTPEHTAGHEAIADAMPALRDQLAGGGVEVNVTLGHPGDPRGEDGDRRNSPGPDAARRTGAAASIAIPTGVPSTSDDPGRIHLVL